MHTEPSKYTQSGSSDDRRKHSRFNLRAGTYAGCLPNIGEIVDIGLGGIAFSYVEFGGSDSAASNFILCGDGSVCLEDLSCTVVSDNVCSEASNLSRIVTRLRRVQFDNLTEEQKAMIQNFISINRQAD